MHLLIFGKYLNLLYVALILCVFILLASYVFLANSMSGDAFKLETLNGSMEELAKKNQELTLRASKAQSLAALRENSKDLGLEEVEKVTYIKVQSSEPLVFSK